MKTEIEKRASKFIDETDMMQFSTMEIMVMFAEKELAAINYTRCCESDSEQLVLFADWLQYNGKWSLPEQQAEDFLKEQQEQN